MSYVEPETPAERQLSELRDAVLDDWILITSHSTDALRAMQSTVSWRVTRPLRVVRTYSYKSREIGLASTGRLAAHALASKLGRRG
jgi:hypothetical protein